MCHRLVVVVAPGKGHVMIRAFYAGSQKSFPLGIAVPSVRHSSILLSFVRLESIDAAKMLAQPFRHLPERVALDDVAFKVSHRRRERGERGGYDDRVIERSGKNLRRVKTVPSL